MTTLRLALERFQQKLRRLFVVSIAYRALALVLLTPLSAILFRGFLSFYSNGIVADEDLVFFFLSPIGLLCLVVVGSFWLVTRAMEMGALFLVLAEPKGSPRRSIDAIRASLWRIGPLLAATGKLLIAVLLWTSPLLLLMFALYRLLLSEFDINYYLSERPAELFWAVGLASPLAAAAVGVGVYFLVRWLFAIPLILLHGQTAAASLRRSAELSRGRRIALIGWHVAWFAATSLISSGVSIVFWLAARWLTPLAGDSIWLLSIFAGAGLLSGILASSLFEVFNFAALVAIIFQLFLNAGVEAPEIDEHSTKEAWPSVRVASRTLDVRPTWPRIVAGISVGAVAAGLVGATLVQSIKVADDVLIMAHRGASLEAPENTLAAMKRAIELKSAWVEIDVQLTADNEVVVVHDADLMRVARQPTRIHEATLEQLREIDVGGWRGSQFRGERIPTLAEVLLLCRDRAGVNIELKPHRATPGLEAAVVDLIRRHGMTEQVVVMSLNASAVAETKRLAPELSVGMLLSVSATRPAEIRADFLAVNKSFADRNFIRSAHANGKPVYVWTVNDPATMSAMISRGVDALITDNPAAALEVLQQRGEMTPAERLLATLATELAR